MIKSFIESNNTFFFRELRRSIKDMEVEERMDLLIHRPLGLLLSWGAIRLGLSPTQVSLLSLLSGLVSGILFYWHQSPAAALAASFFLILAGLLDSADGQVARLTGRSSHLGMVIDGTIDYLVFFFAYTGASLALVPEYGPWILLLAVVSGFGFHGPQTMVFEFYKNEMQYYAAGRESYRNRSIGEIRTDLAEARGVWNKILAVFYLGYVGRQQGLISRKGKIREDFDALNNDPQQSRAFREAFKKTYAPYLTGWALVGGTNTHRTLLMVFAVLGHFELFLLLNFLLHLPLKRLARNQAAADLAFIRKFGR